MASCCSTLTTAATVAIAATVTVSSPFEPDSTRMANVAHLMAELATNEPAWLRWQGRTPVAFDDAGRARERARQAAPAGPGG